MLRRFFNYYKPYKGLFMLDFSAAVLVGLLELAFPLAVNYIIDELLPSEDFSIIMLAAFVLLMIYLLNTLLHFVVTYWGHMLGINIETTMRQELMKHQW